MLKILFGEKGAGKSKRIIDAANNALKEAKGSVIYIADNSRYMLDVKHQVRFIDASEYGIDSPKMFYGFICGLAAQDFDLEMVFIDGFMKIVHHDLGELEELFAKLDASSEKFGFTLTISVNGDPALMPEYLKSYPHELATGC